MHNWMELRMMGRERVAAALRAAEESRRAKAALDARSARMPAVEKRPATLILSRGEVLGLRSRRGNLVVTCVTGRLWVTAEGSGIDTMLTAGDTVRYRDAGLIVIEALRTAALRLDFNLDLRLAAGTALRPALLLG